MRILFTVIGLIIADMLYLVFLSGSDSLFQPRLAIMFAGAAIGFGVGRAEKTRTVKNDWTIQALLWRMAVAFVLLDLHCYVFAPMFHFPG